MQDMTEQVAEERSPSFVPSVDSLAIERLMMEMEVGDVLTYEQMSGEIGRDVRVHAISAMQSARRRCFRADGRCFDAVTGIGLKRLSDVDIVNTGSRSHRKIRNESNRAIARLTHGIGERFGTLPQEQQIQHNRDLSIFGALRLFSSAKSLKEIGSAVAEKHAPIPLAKLIQGTVSMFSSNGGSK